MVEINFERLVPASEALELLAREHDRRGIQPNIYACHDAAHETVLARLLSGHLKAYAEACEIDCTDPTPDPARGLLATETDFFRGAATCEVPLAFWINYHNAGLLGRQFDPVAGDFRFGFDDESRYCCYRTGGAYSVYFDRIGLPRAVSVHSGS